MDKATFYATKRKEPEYESVVFEHPAFDGPFRLVANQFADLVLGGHLHKAVPMQVRPPEQKGDANPKLVLSFPRQVVGREFKRQLLRIVAVSSLEPITITYSVYMGTTEVPQTTWKMFASDAGGIAFNGETVQVSATVDNPMRRAVGLIYDPGVFTGLALL